MAGQSHTKQKSNTRRRRRRNRRRNAVTSAVGGVAKSWRCLSDFWGPPWTPKRAYTKPIHPRIAFTTTTTSLNDRPLAWARGRRRRLGWRSRRLRVAEQKQEAAGNRSSSSSRGECCCVALICRSVDRWSVCAACVPHRLLGWGFGRAAWCVVEREKRRRRRLRVIVPGVGQGGCTAHRIISYYTPLGVGYALLFHPREPPRLAVHTHTHTDLTHTNTTGKPQTQSTHPPCHPAAVGARRWS